MSNRLKTRPFPYHPGYHPSTHISPRLRHLVHMGVSGWYQGWYGKGHVLISLALSHICVCMLTFTNTGIIYHWIAVTNINVILKVTLSKLYVKPYNIPTSLNEISTIFMNQYFYSQIKMFHMTSSTTYTQVIGWLNRGLI
jgi:hypothetical protein